MTNASSDHPVLRLTIDYADHLNARDLGDLLHEMDGIYDKLLYSSAPFMRDLPTADAARLRVRAIHTGSFVVELVSGISQIAHSFDPALTATITGGSALFGLGKLVRNTVDWALDLRRRDRDERLTTAERELELSYRKLDLARHAGEVIRALSPSPDATAAAANAALVLQGAAFVEASNALGIDVERMQQVILRSQITGITVELEEGTGEG